MEKQEKARALFHDGYRCSQAVLEAFAEDLGLSSEIARKISLGLAAGSGAGGECGAVSAAYLVNGMAHGFSHPGDPERFRVVMQKNTEFLEKFKELHGRINCHELIGVNLMSAEGKQYFNDNDIKNTVCTKLVEDSVQILQELI
jgi:C_GCAxxG_C_C family probable redox protein